MLKRKWKFKNYVFFLNLIFSGQQPRYVLGGVRDSHLRPRAIRHGQIGPVPYQHGCSSPWRRRGNRTENMHCWYILFLEILYFWAFFLKLLELSTIWHEVTRHWNYFINGRVMLEEEDFCPITIPKFSLPICHVISKLFFPFFVTFELKILGTNYFHIHFLKIIF